MRYPFEKQLLMQQYFMTYINKYKHILHIYIFSNDIKKNDTVFRISQHNERGGNMIEHLTRI